MADTVLIDQSQQSLWANERTLKELLIETRGTNDILDRYIRTKLGDNALDGLKKSVDEQTAAIEDANDTNIELAEAQSAADEHMTSRQEYAMKSLGQTFRNSLNDMSNMLNSADPGSMFNSISRNLDFLDNQFDGVNTSLAKFITFASYAADVFSKVYDISKKLNDAFLQSYAAGVRYQDGLSGLNQMVGASGMSMQDFTGIMIKYNQSFTVLGSKTVMKLNSEFKNLTNSGTNLMMTQQESQEGLMSYVDIMRMSGRLQRASTTQITTGANEYLQSINELSKASGRAREELLRSSKDALAQPEFQAFMRTLDEGARANMEKGITSLAAFGSDIQNEFKNLIAAESVGGVSAMYKVDSAMIQLANTTGQMPKLMRVIELAKAGKDTTEAMLDFTDSVGKSSLVSSEQLSRMAKYNPMFADMERKFGALAVQADTLRAAQQLTLEADIRAAAEENMTLEAYRAEKLKRETEDSKLFGAANAFMSTQMTELGATINELALTVMPVVVGGMRVFGSLLYLVNKPLELLTWSLGKLTDGITYLLSGLGNDIAAPVAGVIAAGSIGVGGYMAYNKMKSGIGNLMPDGLKGPNVPKFPKIPGLGSLGEGLSGFGKGMGGLGKGVGDSITGVMAGIANGFKAFGDPKVLLGITGLAGVAGTLWVTTKALQNFSTISWEDMGKGAAVLAVLAGAALAVGFAPPVAAAVTAGGIALGTAIGAIGAGFVVAGIGIDIMGDGLVSIANGLTMFGDIDGANLVQVGLGASALGAGLAILGGGEVVKAIGSFASWIGSFFQEDPIDRLKRFGELGEPLGKAGPALDAFGTAFLNATAKMNASTLNDSVTTSMDQIMAILNMDASGMLGGEPPIIGQINSLADAMKNLNNASDDLTGGVSDAATPQAPGALSSSDLQKRTLAFYDNQKASNASMIELLQLANVRLEDLNIAVTDGAYTTSRTIRRSGNRI